jgi:hypothetical protein
MDDVGLSLTSRLQQVMESPQYQISFFSEANLRAFLKSTLDDPNPLPYRFPISHEVIATLLSSFLGFGAVNAEEWGDVNEEMMFEMGEIQALLSNNKSHFYPPPQINRINYLVILPFHIETA